MLALFSNTQLEIHRELSKLFCMLHLREIAHSVHYLVKGLTSSNVDGCILESVCPVYGLRSMFFWSYLGQYKVHTQDLLPQIHKLGPLPCANIPTHSFEHKSLNAQGYYSEDNGPVKLNCAGFT